MWSEFEEKNGLFSDMFKVLEKAESVIPKKDLPFLMRVYVSKVYKFSGITQTREIYQRALEVLEGEALVPVGIEFANVEKRVGEIDRARGVFRYLGQFSEPNVDEFGLWKSWEAFEIEFGNEDTYKELIRLRKFTQQKFDILPPSMRRVQQKIKLEEQRGEKEGDEVSAQEGDE